MLLAHPERSPAILAEVRSLKSIVSAVDSQNFDAAMNMLVARKTDLANQLTNLADADTTTETTSSDKTKKETKKDSQSSESAKTDSSASSSKADDSKTST